MKHDACDAHRRGNLTLKKDLVYTITLGSPKYIKERVYFEKDGDGKARDTQNISLTDLHNYSTR